MLKSRRGLFFCLAAIAVIATCIVLSLSGVPVRAQTVADNVAEWQKAAGSKMSFEVASVKPNALPPFSSGATANFPLEAGDGYTSDAGFLSAKDFSLSVYIAFAYKLTAYQTQFLESEVPKWATVQGFDIQARAGGKPSKDQMRLMMQSLLADRFKLQVHSETRQLPVFALILAKPSTSGGPNMRMKTIGKAWVLAMAVSGIAALSVAQTAQKPQFEVASIRPSTTVGKNKSTKVDTSPGNLTITNVTLQSLVRWAYGSAGKTLADYQVSGGPDWTRVDLYDISAKPASAVSDRDQYRVMLQALLSERFKLIVHSQQKQSAVYTLNLGKDRPQVTPSTAEGNVRNIVLTPEGLAFRNALMSEVADFLAGLPAFDRPVLDRTGLQGRFDLTIPMMLDLPQRDQPRPNGQLPLNGVDFSSYSYGLGEIGFKLEPQQAPIEILVIDSVQRPTEN